MLCVKIKKTFPILFILLMNGIAAKSQMFSQNPFTEEYKVLVKQAVESYEKKEYLQSAQLYAKAFASTGNKAATTDRYDAAASWAMAGNKDSAFVQLNTITRARYSKYNSLLLNTDFISLHNDSLWSVIINKVKVNRVTYNPDLDLQLVERLDTILQDDQKYRLQEAAVKSKFGEKSAQLKLLHHTILFYDSINILKVKQILDKFGWPSVQLTANEGQTALFLVIQHADLKTQEKYLPQIKSAVQERSVPAAYVAMLEDRIAVSKGEKQLYGTQIGTDKNGKAYLEPLIDPGNVNKRRMEVGLGPIEDYLQSYGIKISDKK